MAKSKTQQKNSSSQTPAFVTNAYQALEENLSAIHGINKLDEINGSPNYFFDLLEEDFVEEMNFNLSNFAELKNNDALVTSYFEFLYEKIEVIKEHYRSKNWPLILDFTKIAEYKNIQPSPGYNETLGKFLARQLECVNDLFRIVSSVKHEYDLNPTGVRSGLYLTEKLLIVICLRRNKLFPDTIHAHDSSTFALLGLLLDEDESSIKKAYQKAEKILSTDVNKLSQQKREWNFRSLQRAYKSIEKLRFPNETFEPLEKRLKELELLIF